MDKIEVVIIDDEPYALEILEDYVQEVKEFEVLKTHTNPVEAIADYSLKVADVIFLDIKMPRIDGFELLKVIKPTALIVFTTAFDKHAVDSFEFNTIDYLLKPISLDRFLVTAEKIKRYYGVQPRKDFLKADEVIIIRSSGISHPVKLSDIRYIKAEEDYIQYRLVDKKLLELVTLKQKVEELKQYSFVRIHRSYSVRLSSVIKVRSVELETSFGDKLPIGRAYKTEVHQLFDKWNRTQSIK